MTTLQIITYFRNEDTSSSSFQRFSENAEDMSPVYTFCLKDSARGNIYTNALTNHFDCNLIDYTVKNKKLIIIITPVKNCETPWGSSIHRERPCGNFGRIYNTYQLFQADRFIIWKEENRTFGISPRHYKEILMGLDYDYHFETSAFDHGIAECKTIQYSLEDISEVIFDDNLISLKRYLLDYQMQTIDGTKLGWNDDKYLRFESHCPFMWT